MLRVRKVKLASGGTFVQVVSGSHDYKIVDHVGSTKDQAKLDTKTFGM